MALRDPKIPDSRERSALQLMKHGNWVVPKDIYPAGQMTIASMVRKGWIEQGAGPSGAQPLRITHAGRAALTAKIP